jgi:hypothetical protein
MMDDALFPVPPRRRGRHERAMEQTIRAWRNNGHELDPQRSSALRIAAEQVDNARALANPAWHTGNALRVEADLLERYGPATTADVFEQFMESLTGDLDADRGAAPLRDAPPP